MHSKRWLRSFWVALLSVGLGSISLTTAVIAQIVIAQREPPSTIKRQALDLHERLQESGHAMSAMPGPGAKGYSRFPTMGSAVFDAQLSGYRAYVAAEGTPDILIVGSSRALQGIDPSELRYQLSAQGYDEPQVYNFSVNGATAQVVNFVVGELLPGELPGVIVWGDGSRAFNNGRPDRTWESLIASPGYQAVISGERSGDALAANEFEQQNSAEIELSEIELEVDEQEITSTRTNAAKIDRFGFSAVSDRFDPATYYQEFAKVHGQYDGAYSPFILEGSQAEALGRLATFLQAQGSQLIFVNLPLSDDYLDAYRLQYENQFQDFLVAQADRYRFEVIDLLTQWRSQPELFADPSHINQYGAAAIAQHLARDPSFLLAVNSAVDSSVAPASAF